MKFNSPFQQKEENEVMATINLYRSSLMEDMNLTLRLISNEETYVTKPANWTDNLLIFEAPMRQLDYVLYPQGAKVEIIFVSKNALFLSQIRICKKYLKDNTLYYVGEIIKPLEKKQQRNAFRLDVVMDIRYQLLPDNEEELEKINFEELPPVKATCLNISAGGMCFDSDEQLHSHARLVLTFTFMDKPLQFLGEVLYQGEPTERGSFSHRIKFLNLSRAETDLLNRLIFEKQRQQLKRAD